MEKLKTALWFARRPAFWPHALALTARKAAADRDTPAQAAAATAWAAPRATSVADALRAIRIDFSGEPPRLPASLMDEARERATKSAARMGGPGDLDLLYAATLLSGARRIVETAVAYGWSSLAILAALDGRDGGRLVSVDMPYPKMNNETFVGVVVPDRLKTGWTLIREPDRNGLKKAIAAHGGAIDLCHYDSDKSHQGRKFAFPLLWDALVPGGIFISDDIQDNLAFKEFVEEKRLAFGVTAYEGKYVGIARKP